MNFKSSNLFNTSESFMSNRSDGSWHPRKTARWSSAANDLVSEVNRQVGVRMPLVMLKGIFHTN